MHSVLFVCTANICRSPLAMALLQSRTSQEAGQWRIESAGVWARPGFLVAQNAQAVSKERGIDLSSHFSRPISEAMIVFFRLILVMERGQKEALKAAFPDQAERIFLLSEMAGEEHEIVDPIGGLLVDFEATAVEIDHILFEGYERIRQLSKEP